MSKKTNVGWSARSRLPGERLAQASKIAPAIWLTLPLLSALTCTGAKNPQTQESPQEELKAAPLLAVESAAEPASAATSETAQEPVSTGPSTADAGTTSKQTVWVVMKSKAALAQAAASKDWGTRGKGVYDALVATSSASQSSLHTYLVQKGVAHQSFWILNAMKVEADQALIDQIAQRSDVAQIVQDRRYAIPPQMPATTTMHTSAVEWGVSNIHAPDVWSKYGARGDGIVVASVDTGVEYTHPALVRQYRGTQSDGSFVHDYNWYDPTGMCGKPSLPCDNVGHGTHTMGTMVGDDGDPGANQVGVAPHARWVAAKGCETDGCSTASLLAAAQWILAPTDLNGQNPRPDLRPNVVNNSWGGGSGDTFFQGVVDAWISAGIFPAFANGNSGPSCGSANSPGDYPESYAAGAYDQSLVIAPWSSRGPSMLGVIKPNLAAPGVNIRSSVPGGSYAVYSGTSMASPHLSGTVALMWSAAPALLGDIASTRTLLDQAAVDTADLSCGGDAGNNDVWGQGRLDALAAVVLAPVGPTGTLQGTVTDASGQPLPSAALLIQGGPRDRTIPVAGDGTYQARLSVGSYTVTAKAFGFLDVVMRDVAISENAVTVENVVMTKAPTFMLSGTVRLASGAAAIGASVTLAGTPLPAAITDSDGHYAFASVPQGNYQVGVQGHPCYQAQASALVLAADTTLDFVLPQRGDGYGYTCAPATYAYVQANTLLPVSMFNPSANVDLPFPFTLYGQTYEQATVTQAGYLTFVQSPGSIIPNSPIPNPAQPNAAIYPFWTDLMLDTTSSVRTELLGTAPQRQFVIEWRDVMSWTTGMRTSFEVILTEDSRLEMQYVSGSDPWQQGQAATIGIEDASGGTAFQYSFNQPAAAPQSAVLYALPPSATVQGTLKDANDNSAVGGATIQAVQAGTVVGSTTSTPSGFYRLFLPAGSYTIVASKKNYDPAQSNVQAVLNQTVEASFILKSGVAGLTPANLQLVMPIGHTRTRTLTLKNTGTSAITFALAESGGGKLAVTPTRSLVRALGFDANAYTTKGLFSGAATSPSIGIQDAGDVLKSFVPAGMQLPWGVGVTGNLWLSDPPVNDNVEVTTAGAATGRKWATPWSGQWGADMAVDAGRGLVCQLGVGTDNGIHCWKPDTGAEQDKIVGAFPWTVQSQRGLAYRPDDDSFYVGGWNDQIVYHVKGLGTADKGTVISSCRPADGTISGLAYNPNAGVLWVATNSPTDTIYELNPDDCTVVSTLAYPTPGFNGGGLDMDQDGNLWMINQGSRQVLLMDSGVPSFSDVAWLSGSPASGTLAVGKSANITVKINTSGLAAGVYLATLYVQTTAAKQALLRVPVSLVVTPYQQGIVAGGSAYTDGLGDTWAADRAYSKGAWGYVQKSKTASTKRTISGTSEQALFRTQRIDPYAYRFDNVPNGVYQIDLNFAEIGGAKMGKRLYDVIIEDTLVLPAHDVAYEVGSFAADKHVFFIEVDDGQMDLRLVPRAGSELPVIDSLRVTHRPDR